MADYIHEMRALVGHRPMILNTAAGALLDDDNRLLLQERTDTGDWSFPGGYMEFGASFAETCQREYLEDAGLEVEPLKLLKLFDKDFYTYPNGDQTQLITALYLVKQTGGQLLDHVTDETKQVKYFALDQLPPLFNEQSNKMAQAVIDEVQSWQEG
ncbi:NUDIX hydrolase [Secundilactobacillus odoratitofui]|nr:NUDIX domain-containing protein [Secundilactobacillus odoratitofui]